MFKLIEYKMKTYKLILGGRGADIFIHPLNEEQKSKLIDMDITEDDAEVDFDELTEILGVDSWDYADESYTGAYYGSERCHIQLRDENDEAVWVSDDNFSMNQCEEEDSFKFIETENVLVIEHSVKGTFKEYTLTLEDGEEFDPSKLTYTMVDVHEYVEIITGLKYDGKVLEDYEWGDYWSKGTFFYLF